MSERTRNDSMTDRLVAISEGRPVPGLIFIVTSSRLKQHMMMRAEYHEKRAADKEEEVPKMERALEELEKSIDTIKNFQVEGARAATPSNFGGGKMSAVGYGFQPDEKVASLEEQVGRLKADVREHRAKAASFRFMAESLFGTDYALTLSDLVTLEAAK